MRRFSRLFFLSAGLILSVATAGAIFSSQGGSATLPESDLRAAQPIVCQATDSVELSGRHIITEGDGIEVNGDCDVTVTGSHILAGGTGILVNGSGQVTIDDSFIQGGDGAVVAHAMSEVSYRNSTLRGGTAKYAMAKLVDEGGGTLEDPPSPYSQRLEVAEPITCGGNDHLTISNRYIETDGDGLVVEGRCEVLLSDCYIVAGGYAVRISNQGSVRIRNSTLEGTAGAVAVSDSGRAHVAGSNIRGRVEGEVSSGGGNAMK
jgi:hypothetical protein